MTLESMKRNLPKVFGVKNDFFAEMLFSYISEHAPLTHVINFVQFFEKLLIFWPKKELVHEFEDKASQEWRERLKNQSERQDMRAFSFAFIRVSGGRMLNILDLIKLCCYFEDKSCAFGQECENLMAKYKKINIEPRYVH